MIRAIEIPTLLVIGDSRPVVTLELAAELQSLNPWVRIEQIPNADHGLPFDEPERLGEVAPFLRGLPHATCTFTLRRP